MESWRPFMLEEDKKLYAKIGNPKRQQFGKRPAMIVVDMTIAFMGSSPKPILESVEEFRTSCGDRGWAAVPHIAKLIESCRSKGFPVVFTAPSLSSSATKTSGSTSQQGDRIPEAIAPRSTELVIHKPKATAFFETGLNEYLRSKDVDCLLVVGCTTSGCVRATAVDGFNYGFKVFVVEEGTFDRYMFTHYANLFDMNLKYANVIPLSEALKYLEEAGK